MANENQQLKIDPYTSTVPMVQMPVEQMESGSRPAGPLPGQFGGHKGSGGRGLHAPMRRDELAAPGQAIGGFEGEGEGLTHGRLGQSKHASP